MNSEIYSIVPAGDRPLYFIVGLLALLVLIVVVVGWILLASLSGSRKATFELTQAGLRLRGDLYGREIPFSQIRGRSARIADLTVDRELQTSWKRMGTALPGYKSGWFSLRNGEKALLYVTETSRVVYVPTTAGYSILLSVQEPEQFIARLKQLGTAI